MDSLTIVSDAASPNPHLPGKRSCPSGFRRSRRKSTPRRGASSVREYLFDALPGCTHSPAKEFCLGPHWVSSQSGHTVEATMPAKLSTASASQPYPFCATAQVPHAQCRMGELSQGQPHISANLSRLLPVCRHPLAIASIASEVRKIENPRVRPTLELGSSTESSG